MPILAFDLDGTLTLPKQRIDPEMAKAISKLIEQYPVWIITGASRKDCDEQLGELVNQVDAIYCESGTEVWHKDKLIGFRTLRAPEGLADFLADLKYPEVDFRVHAGVLTLQFSDLTNLDEVRAEVASRIRARFPTLTAHLAGRKSVDVLERDAGKHLALEYVSVPVWYWGDECYPGGNDWSIASQLRLGYANRVYEVKNWQDTLHQLREFFDV